VVGGSVNRVDCAAHYWQPQRQYLGASGATATLFSGGAILSSIALIADAQFLEPVDGAGLLWLLDTSANISMEPFRAFVGDLLPPSQRTKGFAMQSLFIGLGSVIASILPWVLTHTLTGRISFQVGPKFP
jgi:maltose/moltooligosaccharide transporter